MEVSPFNPSEVFSRIGYSAPDRADIVCLCGGTNAHPTAVRVACGAVVTEITQAGVRECGRSRLKSPRLGGRGVAIEIEYVFENCEHKLVEVREFHKGDTFAHLLLGWAEPLPDSGQTIWRD